ncbi:ribose-5-phosphate isomerase RpiA [Leuconostoc gelidum subsp. gasicomitatum]|uniref:ribose-5-phosphate isomerase RpiA n=1 Tax=Leuconostoc gasicomitatum TaxID=115778 RepID=UPI001CC73998|nr:ribose-5-phosphate isomerase RpiA [Leuconostoc gasicomitatum]MBZ5953122.1 ribose-5-phosphate isomerase RpiA [Leuconostoc gasicomitatum]
MITQDEKKKRAAEIAVNYIKDGMVVGLGTGSTVMYLLEAIARQGLKISGVTTSKKTSKICVSLGIKVNDIDNVDHIDVTIDGADEVDVYMNGIKGGGAALLMEKIVAKNSKRNIWIVDDTKVHDILGTFPLPVEVVPYGSGRLLKKFNDKGLKPILRMDKNKLPIVTDGGHYIIDLHLNAIDNPQNLAEYLERQVGVVEHGLFLDVADVIIIGGDKNIIKERKNRMTE